MTLELNPTRVCLERAVKNFIEMDGFHLRRLTRDAALNRVRNRLQEEMIDARYNSPSRVDPLGVECRRLCRLLEGVPGPVIDKLMDEVITPWLPLRGNP